MDKVFAYRGFFIAAYAETVAPGQHVGQAVICVDRPANARLAQGVERVSTVGVYDDESRALQAAEFRARQLVESLQPSWDPFTEPGSINSRH